MPLHGDDRERVLKRLQEASRKGERPREEFRFLRQGAGVLWASSQAHARDFDPVAVRVSVQRFDRQGYLAEFRAFLARDREAGQPQS